MLLRGAFCDPRAGGCRTTNPNPFEKEMDEWSPFDDVEEGRAASKRLELERSGFAPDRNYDGQAL